MNERRISVEAKENMLLKIASFLLIIGGAVCGVISIINAAGTIAETASMNPAVLDAYVSAQSGGMFSGSDALGILIAIAAGTIVLTLVMTALDIVVGIMGLSRCRQPARWRFFLIWGIVLLIIGLIGLGELFSLRGVFAAICGIIGPVLYIIGAVQQNKAFNAASSAGV